MATRGEGNSASSSVNNLSSKIADDPFNYTAGHWLLRDQMKRDARFRQFDFTRLCRKAIIDLCSGAHTVTRYEKIESGFNRVFKLHMENGTCIVARIPFKIAEARYWRAESEVATISYVCTEYIIRECAQGISLHDAWPFMNSYQRVLTTRAVSEVVTQLASLRFTIYGSLYFRGTAAIKTLGVNLPGGFAIGPHCGVEYPGLIEVQEKMQAERCVNRGPWNILEKYAAALIDAGRSRLPIPNSKSSAQIENLVRDYERLLVAAEVVTQKLVEHQVIRNASRPTLMHPDLHKRNIYVSADDPTHITAIIDWQSACIEPIFVYANEIPDLVTLPPNLSAIPEMEENLAARIDDAQNQKSLKADFEICRKYFELFLLRYAPDLAAARRIDDRLLHMFRFCHSTWSDGPEVLRQELIDISRAWSELGLQTTCPHQPLQDELTAHAKQWEVFQDTQKLTIFLTRLLNTDSTGWISSERWEDVEAMHRGLFQTWMRSLKTNDDPDSTEDQYREIWPWDIS